LLEFSAAGPGLAFAYSPAGGGRGSLRRVPDETVPDDAAGLRAANAQLRALLAEPDAQVAALLAKRDAGRGDPVA
jgi:hypothetical protein